ncbi:MULTISPECIES: response regulator transcription factor [Pseudonocardia]|uniref:DNA-binding response regulator, NarL/FixJ family, contains REC and HTH domains n=1 Tax=Pseudonocardia oroxyli TaxID=366584 RepID=A0A1G7N053_PSEOR|nr:MULTISPECIES: response regulator transcription factor [Pseudonocardia]MCF7550320.1 response regulator transcription factor [Pseudonocardia sp. WMMC193]SDF67423.1 DNA-binding response regulator, NarL/FixJ family, contains REC and HTH domains [Pseudonocardia oroxyli]
MIVVGEGDLPELPPDLAPARATAPAEAVSTARTGPADVVVVDLDAGVAATVAVGALAAELPQVPVVAVASDADQVLDVVRAGATGFVLRTDPALPRIVRTAAAGGTAFGDGLAALVLDAAAHTPAGPVPHLTGRESEVLRLVVEGLTARQIATRLVLSPRTVENHVQRVLRKVDVPGRAALVRYAIENGLA